MSDAHDLRGDILAAQDRSEAAFADLLGYGMHGLLTFKQDVVVQAAFAEAVEAWMDACDDDPDLEPATPIQALVADYCAITDRYEVARAQSLVTERAYPLL